MNPKNSVAFSVKSTRTIYLKPVLVLLLALFVMGCSPVKEVSSHNTCRDGQSLLDNTCVSQDVVDYVSCVRSQNVKLGNEKNRSLGAEISYLGVGVNGMGEFSEKLNKTYSASDYVMKQVIDRCDELFGIRHNSREVTDKNDLSQTVQLEKHSTPSQIAVTPIGEQLLPHEIEANQSSAMLEKPELICQGRVIGTNGIKLNRIRVIPAEHAPSKTPVKGRALVTIMETSNLEDGKWYRIEYGDDLSGWIHAKHISTAEHCLN